MRARVRAHITSHSNGGHTPSESFLLGSGQNDECRVGNQVSFPDPANAHIYTTPLTQRQHNTTPKPHIKEGWSLKSHICLHAHSSPQIGMLTGDENEIMVNAHVDAALAMGEPFQ